MKDKRISDFRKVVWTHYRTRGRHDLPWRKTTNPYRILVSEVMLQQTQVQRVIEKYKEFLKKFPTVRALAEASLADVLRAWSGLGYNRRGKYLHDAAKEIVGTHKGNFRQALEHPLPGVGSYTKAAVKAFAFNQSEVCIETNIRAALIHHYFATTPKVNDRELSVYAEKAAQGQDPREWHWALMDYGAYLKSSGIRNNSRSAHYTKQSKFEGSLRQVRGAILGVLHLGSQTEHAMRCHLIAFERARVDKALLGLERDGLIKREKRNWRIA